MLLRHPDGLPAKTILTQLPQLVVPTPFEQTTYPTRPDTRRYEKIVRFATIGPVKAGWLMKDRGRWSLTDEGRSIYKRFSDLEQFTKEADRLYRQWRRAQPAEEEVAVEGPPESRDYPKRLRKRRGPKSRPTSPI